MATVFLKPGRDRRVRGGHPWVYAGEIDRVEGSYDAGDIVEVRNHSSYLIGRGYINPRSAITVRLLTWGRDREREIDAEFWRERLLDAVSYRDLMLPGEEAVRLVHSEGDRLPGLIVDRYGELLVMQCLTKGIEDRKELLADLLMEIVRPASGIYERSDVPARLLEGLNETKGFVRGRSDTRITITENGLKFLVDVADGQKTGYFLDQKLNRKAIAPFAKDARVLDMFTNVGTFALNAAKAGAKEVMGVDISSAALSQAVRNAELNDLGGAVTWREANAFEELRRLEQEGNRYDLIILDPPAFAKGKSALEQAVRGYKEINLRALKLLEPGGFLATASCSYHMSESLFIEMLADAAHDARVTLRFCERHSQSPDHPVLAAVPETSYLKFIIAQAL